MTPDRDEGIPKSSSETAVALRAGASLGTYVLEERIGSGGMGDVFRARDTRLDRRVAIKICADRFSERFEREAKTLSALNHPNVCTLFDVGPNYLVMELIGCSGEARLARGWARPGSRVRTPFPRDRHATGRFGKHRHIFGRSEPRISSDLLTIRPVSSVAMTIVRNHYATQAACAAAGEPTQRAIGRCSRPGAARRAIGACVPRGGGVPLRIPSCACAASSWQRNLFPEDLRLKAAMSTRPPNRAKPLPRRRTVSDHRRLHEEELIDEIVATAERIAAARHIDGEQVDRTDPLWRLLCAIQRSKYCPSISDLARQLRIPKQRAHEIVTAAARCGEVEVLPNPDDRRILQVFLTAQGHSTLSAARRRRSLWLAILLNGLGRHELIATIHILRVIRHRLLRDERERAELTAAD